MCVCNRSHAIFPSSGVTPSSLRLVMVSGRVFGHIILEEFTLSELFSADRRGRCPLYPNGITGDRTQILFHFLEAPGIEPGTPVSDRWSNSLAQRFSGITEIRTHDLLGFSRAPYQCATPPPSSLRSCFVPCHVCL